MGPRVLVPNTAFISYKSVGEVLYYEYPKGGSALKTVSDGDDTAPNGVTVSLVPWNGSRGAEHPYPLTR